MVVRFVRCYARKTEHSHESRDAFHQQLMCDTGSKVAHMSSVKGHFGASGQKVCKLAHEHAAVVRVVLLGQLGGHGDEVPVGRVQHAGFLVLALVGDPLHEVAEDFGGGGAAERVVVLDPLVLEVDDGERPVHVVLVDGHEQHVGVEDVELARPAAHARVVVDVAALRPALLEQFGVEKRREAADARRPSSGGALGAEPLGAAVQQLHVAVHDLIVEPGVWAEQLQVAAVDAAAVDVDKLRVGHGAGAEDVAHAADGRVGERGKGRRLVDDGATLRPFRERVGILLERLVGRPVELVPLRRIVGGRGLCARIPPGGALGREDD
eukprot:IDg1107t1